MRSTALVLTATLAVVAPPLHAQSLDVSGYALGVAAHAGNGDLGSGGTSLLGRFRIMPVLTDGPVTLDIAYEHLLSRTPTEQGFSITNPGGTSGGGDWMGADWTIRSTSRSSWRHRFDRLSLGIDAGPVSIVVGRQAISWATTLFLTPADPFAPFDPSDPFREYRGGVDAVRVRAFAGPFTEVEAVVRPAETPLGTTLTALGRVQTSRAGWAFGAWAGLLHDDGAAAVFTSGALGATAIRGEAELRKDAAGDAVFRGALGADQRFSVADRDLFAVVELQYDGFGASRAVDLVRVTRSDPYKRGEMQTLGRWTAATQVSWQAHPLVSLETMALMNLKDGSLLYGPAVSWSATSAASLRVGAFGGTGAGVTTTAPGATGIPTFGSEYGIVPGIWYASLSVYF